MPSLRSIKARTHNLQITDKVLLSMKNSAMGKLFRVKALYSDSSEYLKHIYQTSVSLLKAYKEMASSGNDLAKLTFEGDETLPKLILVVGAEQGFCGSYSSGIVKKTNHLIEECCDRNIDFKLYVLGSKTKEYYLNRYPDKTINNQYKLNMSTIGVVDTLTICDRILQDIREKQFGSLSLLHSNIISSTSCEFLNSTIFPVGNNIINLDCLPNNVADNLVTDHFIEHALPFIIKDFLFYWLYNAVVNAFVNENSARASTMDAAHKNAEEMIGQSQQKFNKVRQAQITREIIEVISGLC